MQTLLDHLLQNTGHYSIGIWATIETVRRLIKTKSPDNTVQILGRVVASIFHELGVPNNKKK
jgi:hypothetical protein